jgi:hypothetical protein
MTHDTADSNGERPMASGGARYVEFTKPTGLVGDLRISVTVENPLVVEPPRLSVMTWRDGPGGHLVTCEVPDPIALDPALAGEITVTLSDICPHATLIAVSPGHPRTAVGSSFNWHAEFVPGVPEGTVHDNGTLQLGVTKIGKVYYAGTGPRFGAENLFGWSCEGCEGWGLADQPSGTSGAVFIDWNGIPAVNNVGAVSFATTGTTGAASITRIPCAPVPQAPPCYDVTHYFHPSTNPALFQIDVTVTNVGPTASSCTGGCSTTTCHPTSSPRSRRGPSSPGRTTTMWRTCPTTVSPTPTRTRPAHTTAPSVTCRTSRS